MNRHWVKLWINSLDDARLATLKDPEWRLAVECFMVAGENSNEGQLPTITELAWRLRRDQVQMEAMLDVLVIAGLIEKKRNTYTVAKFSKRQSAVTNTQRQTAHKQSKRYSESNESLTESNKSLTDKTRQDVKKRGEKTLSPKNLTKYFGGMK
jgi:DNA-binding MarR family transcriptional regulator